MSMAYILAVNPSILADSGGPCESDSPFTDPAYAKCVESVKRELITSTAIACCFASILMGLLANLPIALAPGMGINAYFTYSVVGKFGSKDISWESALTAVMIEGAIFFVLAVSGVRYALVRLIPEPVRLATPAAIGAFLAHIGLQTAEGLGVVVADPATLVTIGACPRSKRVPMVAYNDACALDGICVVGGSYTCDEDSGVMTSATAWVGMLGTVIIIILLTYRIRSAFIVGISFVTFISWFRNTSITYFTDNYIGDERFDYFQQVVSVEKFDKVVWPFTNEMSGVGIALFTFL
jgi:AGZA family xanthine/uracil permease-like MFS transporter